MKSGRSKLWRHFKLEYKQEKDYFYRCVHCGEIVPSDERRKHLRFKHAEIYQKTR